MEKAPKNSSEKLSEEQGGKYKPQEMSKTLTERHSGGEWQQPVHKEKRLCSNNRRQGHAQKNTHLHQ